MHPSQLDPNAAVQIVGPHAGALLETAPSYTRKINRKLTPKEFCLDEVLAAADPGGVLEALLFVLLDEPGAPVCVPLCAQKNRDDSWDVYYLTHTEFAKGTWCQGGMPLTKVHSEETWEVPGWLPGIKRHEGAADAKTFGADS